MIHYLKVVPEIGVLYCNHDKFDRIHNIKTSIGCDQNCIQCNHCVVTVPVAKYLEFVKK